MNYDKNVYYNTENCGLEIFAEISADLSYEFDILLVLKDKQTGKLYFAQDSGCSCPTPFEDYYYKMDGETNLEVLNKQTLEDFKNAVKNWNTYSGYPNVSERREFVTKVENYLKAKKKK